MKFVYRYGKKLKSPLLMVVKTVSQCGLVFLLFSFDKEMM